MVKMFLPEVPEWWAYRAAVNGNEDKSYGAYFVGHVLWQQYRLHRKATEIKLPIGKMHKGGLGRSYIRTGLKSLEDSGLIRVKRFPHKSPEITLVTDERVVSKLP
jgi:hypothetical protein